MQEAYHANHPIGPSAYIEIQIMPLKIIVSFLCGYFFLSNVAYAASDNHEHSKFKVLLVKIGGSSITNKAIKETLNSEAIQWFATTIADKISERFRSALHDPTSSTAGSNSTCSVPESSGTDDMAYVIVHGAGSFGHFTAKEYNLSGKSEPPPSSLPTNHNLDDIQRQRRLMRGLAKTRLSVQTLNRHLVTALIEQGVHAVGISPCFGIPGMQAHGGGNHDSLDRKHKHNDDDETITNSLFSVIKSSLNAGLVPVLHGDACLYGTNDAGILSGDTLLELLGSASWISEAIFLTDVDGVYTSDPKTHPDAQLIPHIHVLDNAELAITNFDASGSSHDHDVTGGLKTKLAAASSIAAKGKNVTIVKCASKSAEHALAQQYELVDKATVLFRRPSTNSLFFLP